MESELTSKIIFLEAQSSPSQPVCLPETAVLISFKQQLLAHQAQYLSKMRKQLSII
jgi:hypothetical protein